MLNAGVSGAGVTSSSSGSGSGSTTSFTTGAASTASSLGRFFINDDDRLRAPPDVLDRPSGTCSLRATCCACAACPVDMLFTTSGRISAHICSALIEPHSMILLFSHFSDTGFVRKSLQPAASAATLSLCSEDAVSATMITEDRYEGVVAERVSDVDASDGVCYRPRDLG